MKKILNLFAISSLTIVSLATVISCSPSNTFDKELDGNVDYLLFKYKTLVKSGINDYFDLNKNNFLFSKKYADDYGFNFLNTTNLDKVYKDSGGTPDGKPVQLNSEYLRALEKDVINRIINRQELQDYVKQQIIKDPFDAKKLMQFVPVGNIIENLWIYDYVTFTAKEVDLNGNKGVNYLLELPLQINYLYLNENNLPVSEKIEKFITINILSDEGMVTIINNSVSNIADTLFDSKELLGDRKILFDDSTLGTGNNPFEPDPNVFNDFFVGGNNEIWIKNGINEAFRKSEMPVGTEVILPGDSKDNESDPLKLVQDATIVQDKTKIYFSDFPELSFDSSLVKQLFFFEQNGFQSYDILANNLGELFFNNIDETRWSETALQYFSNSNVSVKNGDLANIFQYGYFNVVNIAVKYDKSLIKLNPVKVLFTNKISNNVGYDISLAKQVIKNFEYLEKYISISRTSKNRNNSLWKFKNEQSGWFFDALKDVGTGDVWEKTEEFWFWQDVVWKKEMENVFKDFQYKFSQFKVGYDNEWQEVTSYNNTTKYGLEVNKKSISNEVTKVIFYIGPMKFTLAPNKNDDTPWTKDKTFLLFSADWS